MRQSTTRHVQQPFDVTTVDDVVIRGSSIDAAVATNTAIVVCHGFSGSSANPRNVLLGQTFADRYGVFLFDFRGHGASDGISTLGYRESLDVHAVVSLARERGFERVVAVGPSMGGIAVLREAAEFKDVDGIVTISCPANWEVPGRRAKIAGVLVATRPGRLFTRRVLKTRVARTWEWTVPPVRLITEVDAPVVIVHGKNDKFVPPSESDVLHAARPDAPLHLLDGFGHAEMSYTEPFARWLCDRIAEMVA